MFRFVQFGTLLGWLATALRCYSEQVTEHSGLHRCTFSAARNGPVAQLVEHRTFNAVVAGSSPARLTKIPGDLPGDVVELDSLGAEESANIHLNPELLRLFVQDSN